VTGITISPEQQRRATALAAERGIPNAKFELCDALNMKYEGVQHASLRALHTAARRPRASAACAGVRWRGVCVTPLSDNSFDFVWACESGEHMPDKKKYVEEMSRVLKPGGRIVIATWCQREEPPAFNDKERATLDYLYGEWTHPYFISIQEYARLMEGTGKLEHVRRRRCVLCHATRRGTSEPEAPREHIALPQ
jgi:MPBQ/MSBQ methyltransferase